MNPKLAGQHESYIYKQLVDFTTPQRNQSVMTTYAKMLSDADKKNIAAYLGTQLSKPGAAKNKDTLDLGKITGNNWAFGPVRGVGATLGFDYNSKTDAGYNSKCRRICGPAWAWCAAARARPWWPTAPWHAST